MFHVQWYGTRLLRLGALKKSLCNTVISHEAKEHTFNAATEENS